MARLPIPFSSRLSALGSATYDLQAVSYAELAYGRIAGSPSSSRSLPASASAHFAESIPYATLAPDLCLAFPGSGVATRPRASSASHANSATTSTPASCYVRLFQGSRSLTSRNSLVGNSCCGHHSFPAPPSSAPDSLPRPFSASPIPESLLASQHQRSGPFFGSCSGSSTAAPSPRTKLCSLHDGCCPTPSCINPDLTSQPPLLLLTRRQHSLTQTTAAAISSPSSLLPSSAVSSSSPLALATTKTAVTAQRPVTRTPARAVSQTSLIPDRWTAAAHPSAVRCLHNGRSGPTSGATAAAVSGDGGGSGPGGHPSYDGWSREATGPAAGGSLRRLGGGGSGGTLPPRDEGLGAAMEVFDRPLKSLHRDRSAALLDGSDPLLAAVTDRLLDRLEDCRRGFETAVVLGGAALPVVRQLAGGRAGIQRLIVVDSSQSMLDRIRREAAVAQSAPGAKSWPQLLCVRGDEEALPLRSGSVDLIVSCLGLHWVNDLPGAMAQCRAALKPDGLFLSALLGGETLQELRIACALAQMEREGGVSVVVSPFAQVRDAGNLLTRADLRLPSVDVDRFTLGYPSALELVQHLRALGESNAAHQRRRRLSRDSALAAAAVYQSMFVSEAPGGGSGQDGSGCEGEVDGGGAVRGVTATYEVIFMTGWAPSPHQPKAAERGSATVSFQDLADGLVKSGSGVGGTAEGQLLTEDPSGAAVSTASDQAPSAAQHQTPPRRPEC